VLVPSATRTLSATASVTAAGTCSETSGVTPSRPLARASSRLPFGEVTAIVSCGVSSPATAAWKVAANWVALGACVSGSSQVLCPTIEPPEAATVTLVPAASGWPLASPTKKRTSCVSPGSIAKVAGWSRRITVAPLNRTRVCAVTTVRSGPSASAVITAQPSAGMGSAVVRVAVARPKASVRAEVSMPPPEVRKRTSVPVATGLEAASNT